MENIFKWQSLIGSLIGSFVAVLLGLYVMKRTFNEQRQERSIEQEKELLILYLTNFVSRYISIENSLLLGVNHCRGNVDFQTLPSGVNDNMTTRDNVFSNLDIIYAIYNMVFITEKENETENVIAISDHNFAVKQKDRQVVYCENLKMRLYNINFAQVMIDIINKEEYIYIVRENTGKQIARKYVDNIFKQEIVALVNKNYFSEIKERILFDLGEIYKKDMKLRSLISYPIKKYECFN